MMFARLPMRAVAAAAAPAVWRATFASPVVAAWAQTAAPWTAVQQCFGLATASSPAPPKRAPNAWLLYTMERRPALKLLHPDMKAPALLKVMGDEWKNMGTGFKQNWERSAAEAKEKHAKEVAAYESKYGKIAEKKKATKAEKQAAAERSRRRPSGRRGPPRR